VLEFGAVAREFIDRLVMLLLGARFVMALLDMLVLGVRLIIDLLVMLVLGARFVMARLDMLELGARLIIDLLEMLELGIRPIVGLLDMLPTGRLTALLELRLGEILREMLEEFTLGAALEAAADLETLRLELLDLPLERLLAANTGSLNSKRANNTLKTRKSGPP
jgi:hypothetical protein